MISRVSLLLVALYSLSACVIVPRIKIPEQMSFDHIEYNIQPMSYNDTLCQV